MLAYNVFADGQGYSTSTNKFFWSRLTADKFCESQLYENLLQSFSRFVQYNTDALSIGTTYRTIRRDIAFNALNQFVASKHPSSLLQLAIEILSLESHMRLTIPGNTHPYHHNSKMQFTNLVWLCIRIRKQFKLQT